MSTALITVGLNETVERADLDMHLAGIRHFPVVDDRNHLVGIISDRDLLRAFGLPDTKVVSVRDVMTSRVRTADEAMPAAEALEALLEFKIGCLPVVGSEGQRVGLVTETDYLQVAYKALTNDALDR